MVQGQPPETGIDSQDSGPTTAWDYVQGRDLDRWGHEIGDPRLQAQWGRAVFLAGTLPYLWKMKVPLVRRAMFDALELQPGQRVFVLGEALEPCGFVDDLRARVGPQGEIHTVEIIDQARDAYFAGVRGPTGALAQWRYRFTDDLADDSFDAVAILQGVQHTDDWRATGTEMVRILRPGGICLLAEICIGGDLLTYVRADLHIEVVFEKLCKALGWRLDEFGYYSPEQLSAALDGLLIEHQTVRHRGLEVFWGRKPPTPR
jgi:SAM-dependent methyltransferase